MTKNILAFYKFLHLKNPQKERAKLATFLRENSTVGTIILSNEGINGMCSLDQDKTEKVKSFLQQNFTLTGSEFKENRVRSNVFKKLSIKVKKEIVPLGLPEIDPTAIVGTYIEPEEWDSFISKKEVVTIDTRNDFEVELGTFEGSVNPQTVSFHEFAEWWKDKGKALKNKKIAMFCTGGIRCEKATSFLKTEGLEEVYHLKGGILNYFDKVGNSETSTWKGDCFVFDERMSLKPPGAHPGDTPKGICVHTQEPTQNFINCLHDPCHKLILVHPYALEVDPENQLCPECKAQGRTLETAHYKGSPSQPAKKTPKQRRNRQERRSGDIAAPADAQGRQETQDA